MDTSRQIPGGLGPFPFRPDCVSGFEPSGSGSTSLKWGADGELTALDLHKVLARLCVHDPQVCEVLDQEREAG
jgi:hypothetical protein